MNSKLAQKLIEKGAIRQGTLLEAYYNAHGLSCLDNSLTLEKFYVKRAVLTQDGEVCFIATGGTTNETLRFLSGEVIALDGMDAIRIARTYELSLDGENAKIGKRRGRKPKIVEADQAA